MNNEDLFGIWELVKIETYQNDTLSDGHATSGMFVFTRDHQLSVVSGSKDWVMSYCGSFNITQDHNTPTLVIHVEASNERENEGTDITRKIVQLDQNLLVLDAIGKTTGKRSLITWKKRVSL